METHLFIQKEKNLNYFQELGFYELVGLGQGRTQGGVSEKNSIC